MITLLQVIKEGNRIRAYSCTDGDQEFYLSKQEVIDFIKEGKVNNARLQNYRNSDIIRIIERKDSGVKEAEIPVITPFDTVTFDLNPFSESRKSRGKIEHGQI